MAVETTEAAEAARQAETFLDGDMDRLTLEMTRQMEVAADAK